MAAQGCAICARVAAALAHEEAGSIPAASIPRSPAILKGCWVFLCPRFLHVPSVCPSGVSSPERRAAGERIALRERYARLLLPCLWERPAQQLRPNPVAASAPSPVPPSPLLKALGSPWSFASARTRGERSPFETRARVALGSGRREELCDQLLRHLELAPGAHALEDWKHLLPEQAQRFFRGALGLEDGGDLEKSNRALTHVA